VLWPQIEAFLQQDRRQLTSPDDGWAGLGAIVSQLGVEGWAR